MGGWRGRWKLLSCLGFRAYRCLRGILGSGHGTVARSSASVSNWVPKFGGVLGCLQSLFTPKTGALHVSRLQGGLWLRI